MREDDDLDLLLNSALATYADPGADSGLEERILAQRIPTRVFGAAQTAPASQLRWLPWAIALSVAACLVVLAVLSGPRKANPPVDHASQAHAVQQPLIAANPTQLPNRLATPRSARAAAPKPQLPPVQVAANNAPLPKLDVFPTPQPLTHEEQALAVFAIRIPARELQALIEAQSEDDSPLNITAVDIQPLDPPDHGGN
jgi:hypothetical protein